MTVGTPFHPRTAPLNRKLQWREWSGYLAASAYHDSHEIEYNAIREAAALIDVSPLYKYLVSGPDSTRLVDRVITRDAGKLAIGRVYYTSWCNEDGRVVDDGTVARLDERDLPLDGGRSVSALAADERLRPGCRDRGRERTSLGRGDPGAAEPRRPRSGDRGVVGRPRVLRPPCLTRRAHPRRRLPDGLHGRPRIRGVGGELERRGALGCSR